MRSIHVGRALLLLIILFGCQKNDLKNETPGPPLPAAPVGAELILPEGSALSGLTLTVTNGRFESEIVDKTFTIDTTAISNTFSFVTDDQNRLFLMKYYDGVSTDRDISPHSTALALLMSTPLATSLTSEGKENLVQFITSTSEFASLENEVKNSLVQGTPITDGSNTKLNEALLVAFEKMSAGGTVGDTTSPVTITRNGRTISIQNNGAANTFVAGIYKDGNLAGEYTVVPGTKRSAGSISQAVSGLYTPSPSGERRDIRLEGDGNFQIRIRSGSISAQDGSDENALAAKINIIDFAWSIAESFLPGSADCMADVKAQVLADYQFDAPAVSGSLNEVSNAVYALAIRIISDNISRTSGCYDATIFPGFSETVKTFINYLATVSGNASGAINVNPQLFHLYYKESKFDLCYTAEGDNITDCDNGSSDTFMYHAFYAVPGTTIGAAIDLRLKFKGTEVSGTASSTSFDYGSGEPTVPVTGTLLGNTMTLYIHADNNIVPEMVECVPQPAPNCPSCRYTGDHVVQDWEIIGTVNDDHSVYNADYTRKIKYTSLTTNKDCTTSTSVDEVEENGALSY